MLMNLISKALEVLKDPNASADAKELAEAIVRDMSGEQRQAQMMRDLPSTPQPGDLRRQSQVPKSLRFGEPEGFENFFRAPFRG